MGAFAMMLSGANKTDTTELPNLFDPNVYAAGDVARRRTPTSSGQPQGKAWSAEQFVTSMPTLMIGGK
jgi:pyruvate/2-oxoglutarate dehydrogenase complex dihydrolipoamide dehydrogenase (E3) component